MKTKSTPIANIIYPTESLCMEEHLYFRPDTLSWYSYDDSALYLKEGASVSFDTYFNSFSLGKWQENTIIKDVELYLETEGHLLCTVYHMDEEHIIHTVSINEIKPSQKKTTISIPQSLQGGLVYFTLKGLSESQLKSAYWATSQDAENIVKLGLSITTFNRQDAVKASVSRILHFLHKTEIDAHLLVVDNGKNVTLEEDSKLTLIPNENLGGSGGFARGLYHLKEENDDFTHCLFMDDDASCETESIFRTYQLLTYAKDFNLAISGAMLAMDEPNIQWENGANFNYHAIGINRGLNLYDIHNVLNNNQNKTFDYGGWWYFAFPIKNVKYPFPFFVRGDDINFGFVNNFKKLTMNGIATFGDDFSYKESPLTRYLDMRSHFLQHILIDKLDFSIISILKLFSPIVGSSLTLKYGSSKAQIKAIEHVLEGPDFFANNIDMQNIFPILKEYNQEEKLKPINIEDFLKDNYEIGPSLNYQRYAKLFRIITLNGHLLPSAFFKEKNVIVYKREHRFASFFRRNKILVYHPDTKSAFLSKHNKKIFFSISLKTFGLFMQLIRTKVSLKKEYQDKYTYLTSKEYWEKQFFPDKDTV